MKVVYNLDQLEKLNVPGVVTLGNFDGIHLGHRKIITRCVEEAKRIQGMSVVVTYDHQSSAIFQHHREFISLTNEKIEILKNLDVDILILIPFSEKIKNMSADDFLRQLLVEKINTRIIIIGYDHHFGKNREGDIEYLKSRSGEFNYEVIQIDPVYYMDRIISSSRIRSDLVMGEINKVNDQLGSAYLIFGNVVQGFKRGQLTGFPTANILISDKKLLPIDGVYIGKIAIEPPNKETLMPADPKDLTVLKKSDIKELLPCLINIGKNPTFNNDKISVEVHILDFSGNLYDLQVHLYFLARLRDEKKFDGIESLKKQIQADVNQARIFFEKINENSISL